MRYSRNILIILSFVFIYGCASPGGSNSFVKSHDQDEDERLSRKEFVEAFEILDADRNGYLDDAELFD